MPRQNILAVMYYVNVTPLFPLFLYHQPQLTDVSHIIFAGATPFNCHVVYPHYKYWVARALAGPKSRANIYFCTMSSRDGY